jgi:cytochrome c biogenesis protein CcmG/thiol:disulfide interchange protein DsbE
MKRMVLVGVTVLALIAGTYFADRVTRVKPKGTVKVGILRSGTAAQLAPDFTLKDLDGKDVSLSQFKGKVVLINFWATWCDPCYIEIPWLIEMQQRYAAKGFTILGVALDEEGKSVVAPWVAKERFDVGGQRLPMNYPILLGDDAVADKFGGLLGYPTSILISRDGKMIKRVTGILTYDEISKAIESQL